MPHKFKTFRLDGFSLVELMIVVTIIAVISAIALPSYNQHVRKSHRKEAIAMIHSYVGRLERARSSLMSYASFDDFESSEFKYYSYKIDVDDTGRSYAVTAIPSTLQDSDICGTMVYSSDNTWVFNEGALNEKDCLVR